MIAQVLAVAFGGAVGAVSRFLIAGWINRWAQASLFPYGTLAVNCVGSLALGLLFGLAVENRLDLSVTTQLLLSTGFLGALTTFSTFSLETLEAVRAGEPGMAVANVAVSLGLGLTACWIGLEIGGRV